MRFQKEVYDKYVTYAAKGNRIAARTPRYDRYQCPPELTALLRAGNTANAEELGVLEIPVNKIVGIASICGKESYAGDFLPIASPRNSFADSWCNIYLKYLNEEKVTPIICYEYLGKFYVVDGKKRVSVMKCNGIPVIAASVTRIHPADKESPEARRYYKFLECYKTTGLYQIDFCPKFSIEELQNAIGCDVDYRWNQFDRAFMLANLYTVESALKMCKMDHLPINAIDALMVLIQNFSYQEAVHMTFWQMAEFFKKNKKMLFELGNEETHKVNRIA